MFYKCSTQKIVQKDNEQNLKLIIQTLGLNKFESYLSFYIFTAMIKINSIIPKLPAKDLEATRLFYTEKLNFKVINTYPDYLLIQRDNMEIHFFLHRQLDINRNDGMCYVRVTNIEELHKGLKDSNFPNLGKLETRPWRQKEFSICDNQNNQITFGEAV